MLRVPSQHAVERKDAAEYPGEEGDGVRGTEMASMVYGFRTLLAAMSG